MPHDDVSDWTRLCEGMLREAPEVAARVTQKLTALNAEHPVDPLLGADVVLQIEEILKVPWDPASAVAAVTTPLGRRRLRAMYERAVARGVPVQNVLRGLRIGLEEGISSADEVADREGLPGPVRQAMAHRLLGWSDLAMEVAAHQHEASQAPQPTRMTKFARVLGALRGGAHMTEQQWAVAEAAGHRRTETYWPVVVAAPREPERVRRIFDQLVEANALAALVDGEILGLFARVPERLPERSPGAALGIVVGVGDQVSVDAATHGFELAERARRVGAAIDAEGVYVFRELGALPAVVQDDDVGAALETSYVEPCLSVVGGEDVLGTVTAYLVAGGSAARAASALGVHENTVRHRLGRFRELTGGDLQDPQRRSEVWWALARRELRERWDGSESRSGLISAVLARSAAARPTAS